MHSVFWYQTFVSFWYEHNITVSSFIIIYYLILPLSVFLQMCIAGALGIPGSTAQRTPTRNCFVSQKDGFSVTAWGYCVPKICIFDIMKSNSFACFACALFIFGHFADVLVLSTTWNDLFCSCVDDVSIWQMFNFFFFSSDTLVPMLLNSRILNTHFASIVTQLRNDCRSAKLHFQMTLSMLSTSCLICKLSYDIDRWLIIFQYFSIQYLAN